MTKGGETSKREISKQPKGFVCLFPLAAFENPATKFEFGYLDCWIFLIKLIMYLFFCSLQWYVVQSPTFLGKIH